MTASAKLPMRTLFDATEYALLKVLQSIDGASWVVLCEDEAHNERFASLEQWAEGAAAFSAKAKAEHLVTMHSPEHEKISLFRSLFKGRDDALAKGYRNKDGGISYSLVCTNLWNPRLCDKKIKGVRNVNCKTCPNRKSRPITEQDVREHLEGKDNQFRDVLGLYVSNSESMTHVLVGDFDEGRWQDEITAYKQACDRLGICCAVERSRSGNGGHAWIFFEEAVEARIARDLGSVIITDALHHSGAMSFKSYDRFFPAQDIVADGGFGNLIALPLQGLARKKGNTVFVDDSFSPHKDQWRFLSSIRKTSMDDIQRVLSTADEGPLGSLAKTDSDAGGSPSTQRRRAKIKLSPGDTPPNTTIILESMVYIPKKDLSPAAMDKIRRLAAFSNPELYRAQAMRQSVFRKPRIIYLGEETETHLALPRGCKDDLIHLLEANGTAWSIDDRRNASRNLSISFTGALREGQQRAADALLAHNIGILEAPTGYGKSVIGAYIIGALRAKTLVIVPRGALVSQWRESLELFLDINEELPELLTKTGRKSRKKRSAIGQIGAGNNTPSGIVDVALFQSLLEKGDIRGEKAAKPIVEDYDLVIFDECHFISATNPETVMRAVKARNVYGLSATPKRADGINETIFMHCGPLRHRISAREQAASQEFKRFIIPRFSNARLDNDERGLSYNQILDQICTHERRSEMIIADACRAISEGRTPLVLTKRVDHATLLASQIELKGHRVVLLLGADTAKTKREKLRQVREIPDGEQFCIVATVGYAGTGFDEKRLDTLFLAAPVSWEGSLAQCVGRLHRDCEGKSDVRVFDYVDMNVPMLERAYKRRLKEYGRLAYHVASPDDGGPQMAKPLFEADTFFEQFCEDLRSVAKLAFISASHLSRAQVKKMLGPLSEAAERGIKCVINVHAPNDLTKEKRTAIEHSLDMLGRAGCSIVRRDAPCSDFAVLDSIVWYGGIPLLGKSDDIACSLRIIDADVAYELVNSRQS